MRKNIALLLSVLMLMSLLAGCGAETAAPAQAPAADVAQEPAPAAAAAPAAEPAESSDAVIIGYTGRHEGSYPSSSISLDTITQMMIYDKLFEIDDHTGEFTSRILESWEWVDDKTLCVKLKDGVRFSDGAQMTGEDILFSLHNYVLGGEGTAFFSYYKQIDHDNCHVDADGLTTYITFYEPYGPALSTLCCPVMQKAFTEAHGEEDEIWFTGPVGSGPYEITDVSMDAYIVFSLREDYWDAADYQYSAKTVTLKFYTDQTAMYVDYQNGNIDAMYDVSATVCEQIEAAGDQGKVNYISNNDVNVFVLNEKSEALADPAVREAIAHAVDMDAVSTVAYGPLYRPATSHYTSGFDCYTEHEGYSYDPDYAAQLLKDAGYKAGDIVLDFVVINDNVQSTIAETIQGYLSAVGITVNVNAYDLGTALGIYVEGACDLSMFNMHGGNPTREAYLFISAYVATGSFQCMTLSDEHFNELVKTTLVQVDPQVRNDAFREIDDWLYDNWFCVPICETMAAVAFNDRIESFDQSALLAGCLGSIVLK